MSTYWISSCLFTIFTIVIIGLAYSSTTLTSTSTDDESITSHYLFKENLIDYFVHDDYKSMISTKQFIEVDLNTTFLDYSSACHILTEYNTNSDVIAGCYSSLVFTVRNLLLFSYQQLAYNTIMASRGSEVLSLDLHQDAGVLLAATYPILALPLIPSPSNGKSNTIVNKDRCICIFGKFSLKLTLLALSRKNYHIMLFPFAELTEFEVKTINILAGIAKLNNRTMTITQGTPETWETLVGKPKTDIVQSSLDNRDIHVCDFLIVWGDVITTKHAMAFARQSDDLMLTDMKYDRKGNQLGPQLLLINEFTPLASNQTSDRPPRFQPLSDVVLWEGSMYWPTQAAVLERRNGFAHVQQEYDLSFVSNSTQTDVWLGRLRANVITATKEGNKRRKSRKPRKQSVSQSSKSSKLDDKVNEDNSFLKSAARIIGTTLMGESNMARSEGRCHNGDFDSLVLITYTNEVFHENALGLRRAILSLGIADVIATGDYTFDRLQNIFGDRSVGDCNVLQIAMGPHEPTYLFTKYVAYDAEQVWSIFMDVPAYLSVLRDANAIFIMSERHRLKFKAIAGVNMTTIYPMPFYTAPALTMQSSSFDNSTDFDRKSYCQIDDLISTIPSNASDFSPGFSITRSHQPVGLDPSYGQDFDILFFGSCSDYRREFLALLDEHHMARIARGKRAPFKFNIKCLKVWTDALVGSRREMAIRRTKLVVNIHAIPQSSLEVHRLNYLLSMGKCVVSERSILDPVLDQKYSKAVVIGENFSAIIDHIFDLLANTTKISLCEQRARAMYEELMTDTAELSRALYFLLDHE